MPILEPITVTPTASDLVLVERQQQLLRALGDTSERLVSNIKRTEQKMHGLHYDDHEELEAIIKDPQLDLYKKELKNMQALLLNIYDVRIISKDVDVNIWLENLYNYINMCTGAQRAVDTLHIRRFKRLQAKHQKLKARAIMGGVVVWLVFMFFFFN